MMTKRNENRKLFQTRLCLYNLVWNSYTSITCSEISNIPYNLIFTARFNNSSILITLFHGTICHWRMNMLVTSQYQPRARLFKILDKVVHWIKLVVQKQRQWLARYPLDKIVQWTTPITLCTSCVKAGNPDQK